MTDTTPEAAPGARQWWPVLLGACWIGASAWVWATRAGVLLAGHPAYAVLTTLVGIVGLLVVVRALRAGRRGGRRAGGRGGPRRPWLRALGRVAAAALTLVVVGSLLWLRPFPASPTALDAMDGTPDVRVTSSATRITLTPTAATPRTGLVFQPGARVDPRAYVPLLSRVSAAGVLVVVVKQPLAVGFTAIGAPGDVIDDHPEVEEWSVGGHSLGGVVASVYADDHPDEVGGLLLWASYPLDSMAGRTDLAVASVSGTNDGLATPADIEASRADLPASTTFVAVEGAIHAFFGDYGEQPGDGTPTISRADAQEQIAEASIALVSPGP
ncbi:alpha/beta hydrolase [Nocardioides terrigena]|uniref:alpha/beta hydrolase n=1 Tax=Nocardioides terrigena TaxID=424797 RepID=UPI000D2F9445|nr:alpha/beta hydrolase [Nocardioides terrigena]